MDKMSKPIHAKPSLYALYFSSIKEIGLKYGYNIVLHGSLNRDLDLVAIPWSEEVGDYDAMVDEIAEAIGGFVMLEKTVDNPKGERFTMKPHGRMSYIVNINRDFKQKYNGVKTVIEKYTDPQYYLDISVIPTA